MIGNGIDMPIFEFSNTSVVYIINTVTRTLIVVVVNLTFPIGPTGP